MSDQKINEDEARDLMRKAGLDEEKSEHFIQENLKKEDEEDPREEVLEEEEAKKWSTEYQDRVEKEMPEELYEEEEMMDDPEMGEEPMEDPEMGEEPMEEPDMDMDMEDPEGGDEVDAAEVGRAVLDAFREVPGVEVKGGLDGEDEMDMEEPEMDIEEPKPTDDEPEGGDMDIEDEVIEEITNDVLSQLEEDIE